MFHVERRWRGGTRVPRGTPPCPGVQASGHGWAGSGSAVPDEGGHGPVGARTGAARSGAGRGARGRPRHPRPAAPPRPPPAPASRAPARPAPGSGRPAAASAPGRRRPGSPPPRRAAAPPAPAPRRPAPPRPRTRRSSSAATAFTKATFFATVSQQVTAREGRAMASGIPGSPAPLPTSSSVAAPRTSGSRAQAVDEVLLGELGRVGDGGEVHLAVPGEQPVGVPLELLPRRVVEGDPQRRGPLRERLDERGVHGASTRYPCRRPMAASTSSACPARKATTSSSSRPRSRSTPS